MTARQEQKLRRALAELRVLNPAAYAEIADDIHASVERLRARRGAR